MSSCPNLFFGLVAPIGTKIDLLQKTLVEELKSYGYDVEKINVSDIIGSVSTALSLEGGDVRPLRIKDKIALGNSICREASSKDYLAKAAVKKIKNTLDKYNERKVSDNDLESNQKKPLAFIIRQLKRPDEIILLKKVYGAQFIQISANNDTEIRRAVLRDLVFREYPEQKPLEVDLTVERLISDDSEETSDLYGQRISKTFYTADFFVNCKNTNSVSSDLRRFLKGLFGSNLISPTKDEYGSYFAKAASLKTVDMSRQVGAAIFTTEGEIVITGCNDVAKSGGGLFWEEDDEKHRDIDVGSEANKEETSRIIYNFLSVLKDSDILKKTPEQVLSDVKIKKAISESMVGDITEYGRMVHAEMNAITDAARLGRPLLGTSMYVTTYPCHNCAKHIVASGILRVVYIEPYPKSRAAKLYRHAITESESFTGVKFTHFYGISPTLYKLIFERGSRRCSLGMVQEWRDVNPYPVVEIKSFLFQQDETSQEYSKKYSELKAKHNE